MRYRRLRLTCRVCHQRFQAAAGNLHRRAVVCARCRANAWRVLYDARRRVGQVPAALRERYSLDAQGRAV